MWSFQWIFGHLIKKPTRNNCTKKQNWLTLIIRNISLIFLLEIAAVIRINLLIGDIIRRLHFLMIGIIRKLILINTLFLRVVISRIIVLRIPYVLMISLIMLMLVGFIRIPLHLLFHSTLILLTRHILKSIKKILIKPNMSHVSL
jgi:hypothetical protein